MAKIDMTEEDWNLQIWSWKRMLAKLLFFNGQKMLHVSFFFVIYHLLVDISMCYRKYCFSFLTLKLFASLIFLTQWKFPSLWLLQLCHVICASYKCQDQMLLRIVHNQYSFSSRFGAVIEINSYDLLEIIFQNFWRIKFRII